MSAWKKLASAPAASGGGLNVEDVFSTYVYTGNRSTNTITNNIDLSGEGGMVWIKSRTTTNNPRLFDTERGATQRLSNTSSAVQSADTDELTSFNSDGFTLGGDIDVNWDYNFASWTFRKAPKFFDVVTWTGDGTSDRQISHNLGCDVGLIVCKTYTGDTDGWRTLHKDSNQIFLDQADAQSTVANTANSFGDETNIIRPTSTQFTVGYSNNKSGSNHVAYLFAHNNGDGGFGPNGDQDIIKCGSYTGTGNSGAIIDVGFEPQFLLVKRINTTGPWILMDNMRGFNDDSTKSFELRINQGSAEASGSQFSPVANGFQLNGNGGYYNQSGSTYVYMAIRYGPMKVPESSSEVFDVVSYTADNTDNRVITTGNRVDAVLARNRNNTSTRGFIVGDRHRGIDHFGTALTSAEYPDPDTFMGYDYNYGFEVGNDAARALNYSNYTQIAYTWTKSRYFFDTVLYTGNGGSQTVDHNLGTTPNMIWIKRRDATEEWLVWHDGVHSASGETDYLRLHTNNADTAFGVSYMNVGSTGLSFTGGYGPTNTSNGKYIAYLFATVAGVSKVGSYSGTGSAQTIDCGFSSGASWVMVKRAVGGNGDWIVWDSTRGINSGTEPYLGLNRTDEEITVTDYIDPHSSGFTISGDNAVGASGNTYIFYAIA